MNQSLVSINDFTKEEIVKIMRLSAEFEENPNEPVLAGKVLALLFFEPSTRTRLSFESAISRMGGRTIGFAEAKASSISKGESLNDTIKVISNYCDMIIMRHPVEGAARFASEISKVPILNAGDGSNQHPTQTLLDLFSIIKTQGTLEGINVMMVGDLKYGRTVHSLLQALSYFGASFTFVAPPELRLPTEYRMYLQEKGLLYHETTDMMDQIDHADIIYMTRVQQERFSDPMEYERVKNIYVLHDDMLTNTKDNMRILHPLPRINEIDQSVDSNPKAYYFQQAENGVYARMATICHLLGVK